MADAGESCCAVEEQETSKSATYRTTPIEAGSALIAEQTREAKTEACRRKLKMGVKGVGIIVPSTKGICSAPLGIGRHMVACWARALVGCSPTVGVGLGS